MNDLIYEFFGQLRSYLAGEIPLREIKDYLWTLNIDNSDQDGVPEICAIRPLAGVLQLLLCEMDDKWRTEADFRRLVEGVVFGHLGTVEAELWSEPWYRTITQTGSNASTVYAEIAE